LVLRRARDRCCWNLIGKFADGREHYSPMSEQDTDVLEVLVG